MKSVSKLKEMGTQVFKKTLKQLLQIIFPDICLHCKKNTGDSFLPLCQFCVALLKMESLKSRCPFCFFPFLGFCESCQKKGDNLKRVCAPFKYEGPAASLLKEFQKGSHPALAKALAAYMVLQLLEMNFPLPSIITYVQTSTTFGRYDGCKLLAQEMSKILSCSCYNYNLIPSCGTGFNNSVLIVGDLALLDSFFDKAEKSVRKKGFREVYASCFCIGHSPD